MVSDRMKPEARNGAMEKILLTMKEPSAYHFQKWNYGKDPSYYERTISISFSEHLIKCILAWHESKGIAGCGQGLPTPMGPIGGPHRHQSKEAAVETRKRREGLCEFVSNKA